MADHVLAVDLGGTNMRAALVAADGGVLLRSSQPTPRQDTCPDALLGLVGGILEDHPVASAVIGVPGRIEHSAGALEYAPNLPPHWPEALREELLASHLGVDVALANDADLATVGEAFFGAGRGAEDVVYVTVSTGVGAGVVLAGRLVRGRRSLAELGHTIIDLHALTDGRPATVEDLGSGTALGRLGAARGLPSSGAELSVLAREGDVTASEVWEQVTRVVGVAVANLAHLFAPEVVVLGGGLGRDPGLLSPVRAGLADHGPRALQPPIEVRTAELGDDAGLVGAAAWARATEGPAGPAAVAGTRAVGW
ncbi:MAG: ROK family protein [Nitriliruptoraceae bacterium]